MIKDLFYRLVNSLIGNHRKPISILNFFITLSKNKKDQERNNKTTSAGYKKTQREKLLVYINKSTKWHANNHLIFFHF
jgi:hypothetical protein